MAFNQSGFNSPWLHVKKILKEMRVVRRNDGRYYVYKNFTNGVSQHGILNEQETEKLNKGL